MTNRFGGARFDTDPPFPSLTGRLLLKTYLAPSLNRYSGVTETDAIRAT